MREESKKAKSKSTESDIVMRSVHGDVVSLPYSFFQRLRSFHMRAVLKQSDNQATAKPA